MYQMQLWTLYWKIEILNILQHSIENTSIKLFLKEHHTMQTNQLENIQNQPVVQTDTMQTRQTDAMQTQQTDAMQTEQTDAMQTQQTDAMQIEQKSEIESDGNESDDDGCEEKFEGDAKFTARLLGIFAADIRGSWRDVYERLEIMKKLCIDLGKTEWAELIEEEEGTIAGDGRWFRDCWPGPYCDGWECSVETVGKRLYNMYHKSLSSYHRDRELYSDQDQDQDHD